MEIFYYISKALIVKTQNFTNTEINANANMDIIKDPFSYYLNTYSSINKYNEEGYIILNMIHDIYQLSSKKNFLKKNKDISIKIRPKFKALENVFNNIFMNDEFKEKYLTTFSKLQKINYNLKKFGYICKLKKMKLQVDYDLLLNPISSTKDENTICIVQENFKYMFTLNDLIHIIETALTNAPRFFVEVLSPKNPFNNIPFSLTALYNIYFKAKKSNIKTSILFHLFFLCNFNKSVFEIEYEQLIRDHAIKNYVYNTPAILLRKFVLEMMNENIYTKKLSIHREFADNVLVKIMRPFLHYYYISKYGISGTEKVLLYKKILYYKLKLFYQYNPKFGRKYYHISGKVRHASFNTKCILFNNININESYINESYLNSSNFYYNNENYSVSSASSTNSNSSMSYSSSSEEQDQDEASSVNQNPLIVPVPITAIRNINANEEESQLEWERLLNEISSNINELNELNELNSDE